MRAARGMNGDVVGDPPAPIHAEEVLVEGDHALGSGLFDGVLDHVGLVAVLDKLADAAGGLHDLYRRYAATAGHGQQTHGHDGSDSLRQHQASLLLHVSRIVVNDAVDRLNDIQRVQGGEYQVAGESGLERSGDRIAVAHLANHDDVRVLSHRPPERVEEGIGVYAQLALVDDGFFVVVNELDGIFDGDDVYRPAVVDVLNH